MGCIFILKPWCSLFEGGPALPLKLLLGYEMWLHTCYQTTVPPQYHLGLGRNPIKLWMAVEIRPINWLEEFCLSLQFNSAVLAFLICFMNRIQAGCEPQVESGFCPFLPQLAFGGNSVLILAALFWPNLIDSQNFYIHCFYFIKSC